MSSSWRTSFSFSCASISSSICCVFSSMRTLSLWIPHTAKRGRMPLTVTFTEYWSAYVVGKIFAAQPRSSSPRSATPDADLVTFDWTIINCKINQSTRGIIQARWINIAPKTHKQCQTRSLRVGSILYLEIWNLKSWGFVNLVFQRRSLCEEFCFCLLYRWKKSFSCDCLSCLSDSSELPVATRFMLEQTVTMNTSHWQELRSTCAITLNL